jgi:hypothetical protein
MTKEKKYIQDNTDMEAVSNCCGVPIKFTDTCTKCLEHCDDVRNEEEN